MIIITMVNICSAKIIKNNSYLQICNRNIEPVSTLLGKLISFYMNKRLQHNFDILTTEVI